MKAIDQRIFQNGNQPNPSMGLMSHQQLKADLSSLIPFALKELQTPDRRLPSYLLYGSTGSGKGVIVDQFYKKLCEINGKDLPYEVFECNADSDKLLHSELFGIDKKTAPDVEYKLGRIARANGGLIHFDEIGKATSKITDQILIWMERGHYHRLGNENRQTSRAIAVFTMSENPCDLLRDGKWGIDFLNRFRNIIKIPPLAEDTDYILQLANTFAESFLKVHGNGNNPKVVFSKELQDRIFKYNWPGNIRELENTVDKWLSKVIMETDSAPQSTIELSEDLFDKYPPPLSSLKNDTSERGLEDTSPRSLKECKACISSYAIETLKKAKPNLTKNEWDSARRHIKRHEKNILNPSDDSIQLRTDPSEKFKHQQNQNHTPTPIRTSP